MSKPAYRNLREEVMFLSGVRITLENAASIATFEEWRVAIDVIRLDGTGLSLIRFTGHPELAKVLFTWVSGKMTRSDTLKLPEMTVTIADDEAGNPHVLSARFN